LTASELDLVVRAVCGLAEDYRTFGDRSAVDLVRRSGYAEHREELSSERLRACLAEHPEWIASWFAWSDDRRESRGWYVRECGPADFEVGYFDGDAHPLPRITDRAEAVAEYVRRVVADLAGAA
jgi:hypothetical protein